MSKPRSTVTLLRATAAVALMSLTACGGGSNESTPAAPQPVVIAAHNMVVVDSALVESGPTLSGTLTASRIAQLRPQVGGALLSLLVREGQTVRAGELLAVIDTTALADQARAARSQLRSAEAVARTAERNRERSEALFAIGAIAERDAELSRDQALAATANLEDARSRLTSAEKQLAMAYVRAPFAGVVSEVPVSVGDVVQAGPGASGVIATVVDAGVLELEATVSASHLVAVRRGATVEFAISAFPGEAFRGTIARINPVVDAVTGQVRLYVQVPNSAGRIASGLFAEGRVAVEGVRAVAIPFGALDPRDNEPAVKRVRSGVVERVPVGLGLRDDLSERQAVTSGLTVGDTLLVGAALSTPVGAAVRIMRVDN